MAEELKASKEFKGFDRRKLLVFCVFFALTMLLFDTHLGTNSPYTYGYPVVYKQWPAAVEGLATNWDAPLNVPMAEFFYGSQPSLSEQPATFSLASLPIPSFMTSIFMGFTRSYTLASYMANITVLLLLFLVFINFAASLGTSYLAMGVAGSMILLLPFLAQYVGQPMHYITGTAVNFLILIGLMSLSHRGYKNAWGLGLLTGIFLLNYDPYVFFMAAILYFVFVDRLEKKRHYLYFLVAAAAPVLAWTLFVQLIKPPGATNQNYNSFIKPTIKGWLDYFKHPVKEFSLPFHAFQVGLTVAFREIIAYIYWPILIFVCYYLFKFRNSIKGSKLFKFLYLLMGVFLIEMFVTSVFDFEKNTRRALPMLFVFAFFLTFVVAKTIGRGKVKYLIAVLLVMAFVLTFADVFVKDPSIQATQYGEYIRGEPNAIMKIYEERLNDLKTIPYGQTLSMLFTQKRVDSGKLNLGRFVFSQLFLFLVLLALFFLLYKGALLPWYSVVIFTGVYMASMVVRFI